MNCQIKRLTVLLTLFVPMAAGASSEGSIQDTDGASCNEMLSVQVSSSISVPATSSGCALMKVRVAFEGTAGYAPSFVLGTPSTEASVYGNSHTFKITTTGQHYEFGWTEYVCGLSTTASTSLALWWNPCNPSGGYSKTASSDETSISYVIP